MGPLPCSTTHSDTAVHCPIGTEEKKRKPMMMDRSPAKLTCQKQKAEHTKYAQCVEREFLHTQGTKNKKEKAMGYFFFVLMRARALLVPASFGTMHVLNHSRGKMLYGTCVCVSTTKHKSRLIACMDSHEPECRMLLLSQHVAQSEEMRKPERSPKFSKYRKNSRVF